MIFVFKKRRNSGFTLSEIIITMIIVGVLASLALPRLTGVFERVRAAEGVQILTALLNAQRTYAVEHNGAYATNVNNLDITIDRAENFIAASARAFNPADPVANPIADIRRISAYRLRINEEGDITCAGGGAHTCAEAGY